MSASADAVVSKLSELLTVEKLIQKSIEKMEKAASKGGGKGAGAGASSEIDPSKLSGLALGYTDLIKASVAASKVDPKQADNLVKFFDKLSTGINKVMKEMDPEKVKSFSELMTTLTSGTGDLMKGMALSAIIGPFAVIGAMFFGMTVVIITKILENVSVLQKDQQETLKFLVGGSSGGGADDKGGDGGDSPGLLTGVKSFMFGLAISALLGPFAMIGAVFFGVVLVTLGFALSIAQRLSGSGDAIDSPVVALMTLAKDIAWFMLVMIGVALLAPFILVGVIAFGIIMILLSGALRLAELIAGDGEGFDQGPVGSLLKMGRSIALFTLTMVLISLLLPQFAKGVLGFIGAIILLSGTLRLVELIAGDGTGLDQGPLGSLMKMARSIALFTLVMVFIGILLPQFAKGVLGFIGALIVLTAGLTAMDLIIGGGLSDAVNLMSDKSPIGALMKMGKAIFLFSLTMVMIGYFVAQFAIGTLAFAGALIVLTFGLKAMDMIIGEKGIPNATNLMGDSGPIGSLLKMGSSIFLFALTMVGISYFVTEFAIGVLAFAGALIVLTIALKAMEFILNIGKKKGVGGPKAAGGAAATLTGPVAGATSLLEDGGALGELMKMGWALAIFAATMVGVGYFAPQFIAGSVALAFAMTLMAGVAYLYSMIPKTATPTIYAIAGAFGIFALSIVALGLIPNIASAIVGAGLVIAVMLILGFAFTALGTPPITAFATAGAGVILAIAGAFGIFALSIVALSMVKVDMDWVVTMGATLLMVAGVMVAFGVGSIFIVLGAVAMLPAGVALMVIAGALKMLKDAVPDKKWAKNFESTMMSVADVMTAWGANSFYIYFGGQAMIPAGVGLVALSKGLQEFAKVTYTPAMGKNMAHALKSMVDAFVTSFADMDVMTWFKISYGIELIAPMSASMYTLAEAVAKMANLEVVETEVIDDPKSKGNRIIVPKGTRKLQKTDFSNASKNIAALLQSITKPLIDFGEAVSSGSTWFSSSYLEAGLAIIPTLGKSMYALAESVAKMANLEVVMTEVVGAGTKDAKIVPGRTLKLTKANFKESATNIGALLTSIVAPLAAFGMAVSAGEGFWGGAGPVAVGIDMMSTLSKNMVTLAEGVAKMSNLEVVTNEVVGAGTKDAKMVPGKVIKLDKSHFKAAAKNIEAILNNITTPLSAFGAAVVDGQGVFGGDGPMVVGINMLSTLSSSIVTLAEGVAKMSNLEVVTNTVSDPGTKDAKLIPGKVIKLNKSHFKSAATNIEAILSNITVPLSTFGKVLSEDTGNSWFGSSNFMKTGIEYLGTLTESLTGLGTGIQSMANMEVVLMEVADKGTKDAKLVPGKTIKLNEGHFKGAGIGVASLLSALTVPLTNFGMLMTDTPAPWYSWDAPKPKYMKTGIQSLGMLTESLSTLAEGMVKMANLQVVTYDFIDDPNVKGGKIMVPKKLVPITAEMMTQAGDSVGALLTSLTKPLTTFGKAMEGVTEGGEESYWAAFISPDYMKSGLSGVATLSKSLVSLAAGVKAMAKLEVVEYEIINPGTKDAKMVMSGNINPITPEMMASAGKNVGALLTALVEPLTNFGKQLEGGTGGTGSWWDYWADAVSPNYMEKGLNSLATLSSSLGGLANAVIKMASLQVVVNEVVDDPKNPGKKILQASHIMTLSPIDFALAGWGVGMMLSALQEPLTEFGKSMVLGNGLFEGGYGAKGLEGLAVLSESLGGIADAVIKMASLQVVTNTIYKPGTKDAKIIPGGIITLTTKHFEDAGKGVGAILGAMMGPLSVFGEFYANPGGTYTYTTPDGVETTLRTGNIAKGIEGLAAMTEPLAAMAEMIQALGAGEFIQQTVVGGKLVPGTVINMGDMVTQAKSTLSEILTLFPTEIAAAGTIMSEKSASIKTALTTLTGSVVPAMAAVVEVVTSYAEATTKVMDLRTKYATLVADEGSNPVDPTKVAPFIAPITMFATAISAIDVANFTKEKLDSIKNSIAPAIATIVDINDNYADATTRVMDLRATYSGLAESEVKSAIIPGLGDVITAPLTWPLLLLSKFGYDFEKTKIDVSLVKLMEDFFKPALKLAVDVNEYYADATSAIMSIRGEYPNLVKLEEDGKAPMTYPLTLWATSAKTLSDNSGLFASAGAVLEVLVLPSFKQLVEIADLHSEMTGTFLGSEDLGVPVDKVISKLDISIAKLGGTFKGPMGVQPMKHFQNFTSYITMLAKVQSPFDKFVNSFGKMATHMGTFAKNFKIMTPEGIAAYKEWTNAIVQVAKTDMSTINANIDAMRDAAATIIGGQREQVPGRDDQQSDGQKKQFVDKDNDTKDDATGLNKTDFDKQYNSGGNGNGNGGGTTATMYVTNLIVTNQKGSDRRIKNNIQHIGVSPLGINIYEYNYIWDSTTRYVGVMAQELLGTAWESAAILGENGYYSVDYSQIDVDFAVSNRYIHYETV